MAQVGQQLQFDNTTFDIFDIFKYIKNILISAYPDVNADSDISLKEYIQYGEKLENSGAVYFYKARAFGVEYLKSSKMFKIIFPVAYRDLLPSGIGTVVRKPSGNMMCVKVSGPEELHVLDVIITKIFEACITKDIGCCSRYLECSDAMRCVNPYPTIFLHCSYRKNLNNGIIFYGKNKNK